MNRTKIIQRNYSEAKSLLSKLPTTSIDTRYEYDLPVHKKKDTTITYHLPLEAQYISELRLPYNMFFIRRIELHITKNGNNPVICDYPITRLKRWNGGACMEFPNQLPINNVDSFHVVISMINSHVEPQSMQIVYGLLTRTPTSDTVDSNTSSTKLKTE